MAEGTERHLRFFSPSKCVEGQRILLPRLQSAHLVTVLRRSCGDIIRVFTEEGEEFIAQLTKADPKGAEVEILRLVKVQRSEGAALHLAFAPPPAQRGDFVVEKATELGVSGLHPLISERVQSFQAEAAGKRIGRWRRKAIEAAKQCGRTHLPAISRPLPLPRLLATLPKGLRLIGDVRAGGHGIWHALNELEHVPASVSLIVGPAGGFTRSELKASLDAGCQPVSLGRNTLRVETAAIAMLAAAAFWLGSMRGQDRT